jgi:CubicO group peptidase (beta-lactamase class C family)
MMRKRRKNMGDYKNIVKDDFAGCVRVSKGDEIIFDGTYGYADLPNKVSNKINTRFGTASAGKVFVGVGILQLIENGKLKFEDTIGDLLDFDLKDIDINITVEQLLTHTSGIPDYFDESVMEEYEELWTDYPNYKIRESKDLLPLFLDKPMMYKPGEKFQYNNSGFVVLGLIIEKVTGVSFDEYLKENVFKPSNMIDTGYFEMDRLPERCANAYIYDEEKEEYYTNIYSVDVKGTGAGGAFTTVIDIQNFWKALLGGKLISKEMLSEMIRPKSEEYGYGIWLRKMSDDLYYPYFQGEDPGVDFVSYYDLKEKLCVTVVSNFCSDVWEVLGDILEEYSK